MSCKSLEVTIQIVILLYRSTENLINKRNKIKGKKYKKNSKVSQRLQLPTAYSVFSLMRAHTHIHTDEERLFNWMFH